MKTSSLLIPSVRAHYYSLRRLYRIARRDPLNKDMMAPFYAARALTNCWDAIAMVEPRGFWLREMRVDERTMPSGRVIRRSVPIVWRACSEFLKAS